MEDLEKKLEKEEFIKRLIVTVVVLVILGMLFLISVLV